MKSIELRIIGGYGDVVVPETTREWLALPLLGILAPFWYALTRRLRYGRPRRG